MELFISSYDYTDFFTPRRVLRYQKAQIDVQCPSATWSFLDSLKSLDIGGRLGITPRRQRIPGLPIFGRVRYRKCLIVEVDRPVLGQENVKYGLTHCRDVNTLYLVNRHDENAFDKLNKFPIHVHVCIKNSVENSNITSLSELFHLAWACLYDNEDDAMIKIRINPQ